MNRQGGVSLFGAMIISGCTALPELPPETTLSVGDIVNNIRCELRRIGHDQPFYSQAAGWSAAADLTLKVVNSGTLTLKPAVDLGLPSGSVNVAIGGSFAGSGERKVQFKFGEDLKVFKDIPCEIDGYLAGQDSRLVGNLGIYDWYDRLRPVIETDKAKIEDSTYTIEFIVTREGSANLTFSGISLEPKSKKDKAGGLFGPSVSRVNTHTLAITLKKNEAKKIASKPGAKSKSAADATSAANIEDAKRALDLQLLRPDNQ